MLVLHSSLKQVLLCGAAVAYLAYVHVTRRKHEKFLEVVETPSDAKSAHKLVVRWAYCDFPFLAVKSLEFGLFKTYAIPSISKVLMSTRELVDRCPRRYDDTDLLIRGFFEHPPDSEVAVTSLQRLNHLHGMYQISNEDYLYTLCIFIVEPVRWIDRFGYRKTHEKERIAQHLVWQDIGEKMGIHSIPKTYDEAAVFLDKFEEEKMVYNPSNVVVADSTVKLFLSIVPSVFHPLCHPVVHAVCPARLRKAINFQEPSKLLVHVIEGALILAGLFVRFLLPPRTSPLLRTPRSSSSPAQDLLFPSFHVYHRTYAHGYRIAQLGPAKFAADGQLAALRGCPALSRPPE